MKAYKELMPEFESAVRSGQCGPFSFGAGGQHWAGVKSELYFNDPDVNIEISLLAAEYFGVSLSGGVGTWDLYNFEARALGAAYKMAEYGIPDIDYTNPLCKTEADLEKIKWPKENPLDCGRYPLLIRSAELMQKYTGRPTTSFTGIVSPFTLACELFSFQGMMRIIKKKPDFAHQIMKKVVDDVTVPLLKALAVQFPGVVCSPGDAWDVPPNISPKIQREFVFPYYDRIHEAIKGENVRISWWCAYGESLVPDPAAYMEEKLKYTGIVINMNREGLPGGFYAELARKHGRMLMSLIPNEITTAGPPEKIIEAIREIAKTQRCGTGRFLWCGGVDSGTPLEHAETLQAAMRAFSVNPCPTPEEMDRIEVHVEHHTESFGDFCRRHAKENPNGYTFKWLDQAHFYGE